MVHLPGLRYWQQLKCHPSSFVTFPFGILTDQSTDCGYCPKTYEENCQAWFENYNGNFQIFNLTFNMLCLNIHFTYYRFLINKFVSVKVLLQLICTVNSVCTIYAAVLSMTSCFHIILSKRLQLSYYETSFQELFLCKNDYFVLSRRIYFKLTVLVFSANSSLYFIVIWLSSFLVSSSSEME